MIPKNILLEHVLSAIRDIDLQGVPPQRNSHKFNLIYNSKQYPPKYLISLANLHANRVLLDNNLFNGGTETNEFLRSLGFVII